jgi:hypothetical protein
MDEIPSEPHNGDQWSVGSALVPAIAAIPVAALMIFALPSLDLMLETYTGLSILRVVGTGQQIGPNKIEFMFLSLLACAAALAICCVPGWKKARALTVILGLLSGVQLLAVYALLAFPLHFNPIIERLEIDSLPSVRYEEIFSKEPLIKAGIDNPDMLYTVCRDLFDKRKDHLRRVWGIEDEKRLEALFYMNLVSHLWGIGNAEPSNRNRAGCVGYNEETGFRTLKTPSVSTHIQSNIGCCTDHAHILNLLLDRAGIPNRQVSTWGHVFNEARFRDGPLTLDATTNLVFHGDWDTIQNKREANSRMVRVTVFPHGNLVRRGNPFYRVLAGRFRLSWLLQVACRVVPPLSYPEGKGD